MVPTRMKERPEAGTIEAYGDRLPEILLRGDSFRQFMYVGDESTECAELQRTGFAFTEVRFDLTVDAGWKFTVNIIVQELQNFAAGHRSSAPLNNFLARCSCVFDVPTA